MAAAAWHAFGRQLARPHGIAGRLTGHLMRYVNSAPYRLAIDGLDVRRGSRVLELGFGPGEGLAELLRRTPQGSVHGIDVSSAMLAQARSRNAEGIEAGRIVLRLGDFSCLPYRDESFDRVLAVNVAYFWGEGSTVPREIHRVLRPGGRLSVYVTDEETMRGWPFAARDTHRLYDADMLHQMLVAGGFSSGRVEVRTASLRPGLKGLIAVASRT